MDTGASSSDHVLQAMRRWWINTNVSFLTRYWYTATEALEKVAADPHGFTEFRDGSLPSHHIEAVVSTHLGHHNYSGVLLAYALLDEFMSILTGQIGTRCCTIVRPNQLKERGIRRYKKFLLGMCKIDPHQLRIDWDFLLDFAVVRNAIIHANGNRSLLSKPQELDRVVEQYPGMLSYKPAGRLKVTSDFVVKCILATRQAALCLNDLLHQDLNPSTRALRDENR